MNIKFATLNILNGGVTYYNKGKFFESAENITSTYYIYIL